MVMVRGHKSAEVGKSLRPPSTMSLEDLEREARELLAHQERLSSERLECRRTRCDGAPHTGFPYPHEARFPAEVSPLAEAQYLDPAYAEPAHLQYLSERLRQAVEDVEKGISRKLVVSMPPRMGKSQLTSVYLPVWLLHKHPDWKIGLISHSPHLATSWGRQVRRIVEERGKELGLAVAKDAGAVSDWQTTRRGQVVARSAPGQSITGLGFKVMLVDDPVKDYAAAHSVNDRNALWDWWKANAVTRLEPPSLVVVIATRWHEDDMIGRLRSKEHEGDPDDWEVISFPAIADGHDVLGREPGEPLMSPIVKESKEEALARWEETRVSVGSYSWAALYQQRPAPAKGAIFDRDWWRYWTTDPGKVTDDGRIRLLDTSGPGQWLDSWDMAFKGTEKSDFVVGQRWVRQGANRFLIAQQRGRWTFTQSLERLREWARSDDQDASPYGHLVHQRLIEEAANGSAIIDTLRNEISGLKPIKANVGKEARARAVTPEIESGNVYLPLPSEPGFEWVAALLDELRNFPHDVHDDQVDALTQALSGLRGHGRASITVPGRSGRSIEMNRGRTAITQVRRQAGPGGW